MRKTSDLICTNCTKHEARKGDLLFRPRYSDLTKTEWVSTFSVFHSLGRSIVIGRRDLVSLLLIQNCCFLLELSVMLLTERLTLHPMDRGGVEIRKYLVRGYVIYLEQVMVKGYFSRTETVW